MAPEAQVARWLAEWHKAARGDKEEARRLFQRALDESPQFYAKAYANMNRLLR